LCGTAVLEYHEDMYEDITIKVKDVYPNCCDSVVHVSITCIIS